MTFRAYKPIAALLLAYLPLLIGPTNAQEPEIVDPLIQWEDSAYVDPTPSIDLERHRGIPDLFAGSTYDIGGYVKLDAIFDFDDSGNRFQFLPREIPVDGGDGPTTTFHARQIFLNLAVTTPTDIGDLDFFVEGDFFGAGNTLRLRHAFGRLGQLLVGQTWSQLVDEDAFIETLDFGGADSGTLLRVAQIRWTYTVSEYIQGRIGIEENLADTIGPAVAGSIRNRYPALATGVRLGTAPNHVYCLGAIADARYVPEVGPDQSETVWALGLSSRFQVGSNDSVIFRTIGGEGANSLVTDNRFAPTGLVVPAGQISALWEYYWSIAYRHYWRDDLRTNVVYRRGGSDDFPEQRGDEIRSIQYVATNLIWRPVPSVDIGVEYLFGQRENKDRQRADANRLQFSFIWRLP